MLQPPPQQEQQQPNTSTKRVVVRRTNIHYEGALLACAKLGLWDRALEIYEEVQSRQAASSNSSSAAAVFVTDNMILSLVRASVRAARQKKTTNSQQSGKQEQLLAARRAPLDAAVHILVQRQELHGDDIPLVARHLNPLAAAYQSLGLHTAAAKLLREHLSDRTSGPEDEDGFDQFNLHDINAKDKASYSLLVTGAVAQQDWTGAVDALGDMTEAGLYPVSRHLHRWTEAASSSNKQKHKSWKKKREAYLLQDAVRQQA